MEVFDEIHFIAVSLGKSENYRISAGRQFAEISAAVHSPGNSAAQQLINRGYEPTDEGIWVAITDDPSAPQSLRTMSFRSGMRMLAIGRAKDPEAADKAERERQAKYAAAHSSRSVTEHASRGNYCNKAERGEAGLQESAPSETDPPRSVIAAWIQQYRSWPSHIRG